MSTFISTDVLFELFKFNHRVCGFEVLSDCLLYVKNLMLIFIIIILYQIQVCGRYRSFFSPLVEGAECEKFEIRIVILSSSHLYFYFCSRHIFWGGGYLLCVTCFLLIFWYAVHACKDIVHRGGGGLFDDRRVCPAISRAMPEVTHHRRA